MIITGFRGGHRETENVRFNQLCKLGSNIEKWCTKNDAILHPEVLGVIQVNKR